MAKANAVSAAIGTARQFGKQPKATYQANVRTPNFSAGISQRTDYDAQELAHSLGVLGTNIMQESIAADKREQEQLRTDEADRMIAGKTPEELAKFDVMDALQHSDKGFDLTDNPYAVATLEQSIGRVAAQSAKDAWLSENQGVPKSVNEAVQGYSQKLQETYGNFEGNIRNKYAFDKGFYNGYLQDIQSISADAQQKINTEARSQGQRSVNVEMQNLIYGSPTMDTATFVSSFGELTRKLSLFTTNSDEALKVILPNLELLVEHGLSTEKLTALKETKFFQDRKLGEEVSFYPYYKKISENVNVKIVDTIFDACKNPDGTLNWDRASKMIEALPAQTFSRKIPQVNLPRYSGDLDNLSENLKGVLGSIGGILSYMGYGDIAEYTSGYRDPEYNAQVNGAPNSYHTKGDAVDIYLGDLSESERQSLSDNFSPYFREVLYHDAGSGYHLHLGGYMGGLEEREDTQADLTAAAYSPERREQIIKRLEALDSDASRIAKERNEQMYEDTMEAAWTAGSQFEAETIINNSSLPFSKKQTLLRSIKYNYERQNKGALTPEDNYYLKYEKGKLWSDMRILKDYEHYATDPELEVDEELQKKANDASWRINDYWKYVYPSYRAQQQQQETDRAREQAMSDEEINNNKMILKGTIEEMIASGMSRSDIEERVYSIAPKYGIDPYELLDSMVLPNEIE